MKIAVTEKGEAMPDMQNWLVVQTRSRWEKKVAKLLVAKKIETFCPLLKEQHQWSDRVKAIEIPLLKSFLFVRIKDEQRTTVRLTDGVINFVYRNGKPVVIKEKQIQHIRKFQQMHSQLMAYKPNEQSGGKFDLATLNESKNKKATLWIEALSVLLVADSTQPKLLKC